MDTRGKSERIGSSVDSEEKDDETKLVPQDTEETNQKNGEKILQCATTEEGSSASVMLPADSKQVTEEFCVGEEQIPSRTPVQSTDTGKNTCETMVQSGDAAQKSGVSVRSPVDGDERPAIIGVTGATEAMPNVLDPDTKKKSDIRKPFDKAVEEIQRETFPPSAVAEKNTCGTTVPSADTKVHGKTNATSVSPGEEPGLLPVPSENSEKASDTKLELQMEEEILGKTSKQSKATVKHACEAIVQTGVTEERGDVSKSFVDGAKEPPFLPVIDIKPGETSMDLDSALEEKPDLRTKSAVETEEKSVPSADTQEKIVGLSVQAVDTGEDSGVSPINEERFGAAANEKPPFRKGSEVGTDEMPSETRAQCANVETITCETNLHSANTEDHGIASVQPADKAEEPRVLPVFSTDIRKNIDTRAGGGTSIENVVQSGQQSPRTSVDTILPEQSAKKMVQWIDSPKDVKVSNNIRNRKFPLASEYEQLDSLCPASDEEHSSLRTLYPVGAGVLVLVAGILVYLLCGSRSSVPPSSSVLQIFQQEFESLRNYFPGQNEALWLRSHKMHLKHLNKSQPLEPATIILTAARDGEGTLRCLSEGLARTYSLALNASYSVINGSAKAKYESKDAKLQIDMILSSGFTTTSRAAVLHRLEELPPGSVLILYKYCDHENAAFKNVALVFTVLLEVPTLDLNLPLRDLEEKVKDVLWDRFLHTNHISSHDEMDVDKLSGVWSRISHLVLPVVPVEAIESGSCPWAIVEQ